MKISDRRPGPLNLIVSLQLLTLYAEITVPMSLKRETDVSQPRNATALMGLCLKSDVNIDLDFGKFYRILPGAKARATGHLRVFDESGEDYLYPASYFRVMRLPAADAKKLVSRVEA
jgi:hypothetical protein